MRWLSKLLNNIADQIQYYDRPPSKSEIFEMEIATTGECVISKPEICDLFHIKPSVLSEVERKGIIPEGRKRIGCKDRYWFLSTISNWLIEEIKLNKNTEATKFTKTTAEVSGRERITF